MRFSDFVNFRSLAAASAIAVAQAVSSGANALPLPATFTVSGVFEDGGLLSGQFGLDYYGEINRFAVDLTTTAGTIITTPQIYTTPPDARILFPLNPHTPATATGIQIYNFLVGPNRVLQLAFLGNIDNIDLVNFPFGPWTTNLPLPFDYNNSFECYSWDGTCTRGAANTRFFDAGTLTIAAATPLPGALPLFASGAGFLGFLGWRRKRKSAAA